MNDLLLLLTIVFPLMLIAAWPIPSMRVRVRCFTAWTPLPALLLSVFATDFAVDLPWLLFGSRLGLDTTGRLFLAFTSVLWLAAGVYAHSYLAKDSARDRFDLFHLLTMLGNLGVIVSQDMISFLLFYTMMSLAAYGLITHDRKPTSMRAGYTYITLAVLGEVLLFWAAVLTAQQTGTLYFDDLAGKLAVSPYRHVIAGLVLVGFGIKLGLMPLHIWLPLAHPAAPTPASAVLSGAIIKTGLLGMLRFLPLGAVAMHDWGVACIVVGVASALLAVLFGLTQENSKTVLAYSSVSQMGLVGVMVGVAMMTPQAWTMISAAILVYVTHHAVAKASLFLGVGVAQCEPRSHWQRRLVTGGLAIAALSLAGLPLTTGSAAKNALKDSASAVAEPWASALAWVLPFTGLTTSLLVARFLYLVWPGRQKPHGVLAQAMVIPWGMLTIGVVLLFFVMRFNISVNLTWFSLAPYKLWAAVWPILIASAIALVVCSVGTLRRPLQTIHIPAGDLIVPLAFTIKWCSRAWKFVAVVETSVLRTKSIRFSLNLTRFYERLIDYLSRGLENDVASGFFLGMLVVVLLALMIL